MVWLFTTTLIVLPLNTHLLLSWVSYLWPAVDSLGSMTIQENFIKLWVRRIGNLWKGDTQTDTRGHRLFVFAISSHGGKCDDGLCIQLLYPKPLTYLKYIHLSETTHRP